jgi:fumarate reductase subunit C
MPLATILIRMDGCAHSHISAVLGHELTQIFIHLLGILFLIYLLVCLTGFYSLEQFIRDKRVPVCAISSIVTLATPLKMVFMYEEGMSSVLVAVSERLVVQDIFFFPAVSLLLCWITKHDTS